MNTEIIYINPKSTSESKLLLNNIDTNNIEIKKLAIMNLMIKNGGMAEQCLIQEVSRFSPNLVNISTLNIPCLRYTYKKDNLVCQYIDSLYFVQGFFYDSIYLGCCNKIVKQLFITNNMNEKMTYYIGYEIDYETFKRIFLEDIYKTQPNIPKDILNYHIEEINRSYYEWLNGETIFCQSYYFPNIAYKLNKTTSKIITPNKVKQKVKQYTSLISTPSD